MNTTQQLLWIVSKSQRIVSSLRFRAGQQNLLSQFDFTILKFIQNIAIISAQLGKLLS